MHRILLPLYGPGMRYEVLDGDSGDHLVEVYT